MVQEQRCFQGPFLCRSLMSRAVQTSHFKWCWARLAADYHSLAYYFTTLPCFSLYHSLAYYHTANLLIIIPLPCLLPYRYLAYYHKEPSALRALCLLGCPSQLKEVLC
jgi:hypothetical protein